MVRRIVAVGTCMIAAAALAAPAAHAAQGYLSFYQAADGTADVFGGAGASTRVEVTRGGAVIGSGTGAYNADVALASLVSGDVATVYAGGAPIGSASYDGLPSINADACAGRSAFTGTHSGSDLDVSAYTPTSGTYGDYNQVSVTGGDAFTATLARALAVGDVVSAYDWHDGGALWVSQSRAVKVGACPPPPQPPVPPVVPVTPPSDQQVLQSVVAAVDKAGAVLRKLDPADIASGKGAALPFAFPEPGTVTIELTAPAPKKANASAAAAKKTIVLAAGTKTAGASGPATVTVKVTSAGRKLLRKAKTVKLTLTATFTPKRAAKAQTTTKSVTLKHRAKKHKRR